MKIENYIKNAEKIYYDKKIKQSENAKTIIFKSKSKTFTLENINNHNEKIKPAIIENEINSIYRTLDKKIAVFKTTTLNPNYNISTEQSNKEIDKQLKIQYKQLKDYHQFKNQFKIKDKRLKNQGVKIYDLTEALNIHTHSIDILKSKEDLEHYIKSVIYAKKKFDIGRIELCITSYTLKHIKNLFKDFKIRVKNRYITLNLKNEEGIYIIEGQGKIEEGNYIYFKLLDKNKDSKKNLIRYFYKDILSERYDKKPTKEHLIFFSKLGIRIKQFTKDFFNRKVQKHILYRTNNKLFLMVKNKKNKEIQLSPTTKDLKSFLFYTASLFRKDILFLFDKQFVFYSKNNNPTTKWVQIVDLKTYEKEGYEENFNNGDIQIIKGKDKKLLYFFQELEVRNIFIKERFIEEFEKKKFFDKDRISEIWKDYLMVLYYEKSKINIHKYMEEIISDYCETNSYLINVYMKF